MNMIKPDPIPPATRRLLQIARETLPLDKAMWNDRDTDVATAMQCVVHQMNSDSLYVKSIKKQLAEKQQIIDELCSYLDNIGTGLTNTAARHRSPPARHTIKLRSQTSLPIDRCV
tara:strand:+ start:663 stop:1007 length:345 start_codon:yes stop_codon:yes gene_type:complete